MGAAAMRGALTGTPGSPMDPHVQQFVSAATKEAVKSGAEQLSARDTQEAIHRSTANATRGILGRPTIEEKEEKKQEEKNKEGGKEKEREKKAAAKIKKKKRPFVKRLQRRAKQGVQAIGRGLKTVKQKLSQGTSPQKRAGPSHNIGL